MVSETEISQTEDSVANNVRYKKLHKYKMLYPFANSFAKLFAKSV